MQVPPLISDIVSKQKPATVAIRILYANIDYWLLEGRLVDNNTLQVNKNCMVHSNLAAPAVTGEVCWQIKQLPAVPGSLTC